jgi:UDP:flavonoid glycosyltransferase YjiC (YdhE family)
MGHMTTCLAYANRLREHVRPVFFSLASAVEMIHAMGYEADYLVSRFWSRASAWSWDQQLALRLGMLFERVRPEAVVFDGTWPYRGLLEAADRYGVPRLVWSNLSLYRPDFPKVPIKESNFDLNILLGEAGAKFRVDREAIPGRRVLVPPVTLLDEHDLLDREAARRELGLQLDGRYALFSLGSGNLKNVGDIGRGLVRELKRHGITVVWAKPAISAVDVTLPKGVRSISMYPTARVLRAFDIFVGAAGYNTCCEVLQSGVASLLVPNRRMADDQARRAELVSDHAPAVVSGCETHEERVAAVKSVVENAATNRAPAARYLDLNGAALAADEILAMIGIARGNDEPKAPR